MARNAGSVGGYAAAVTVWTLTSWGADGRGRPSSSRRRSYSRRSALGVMVSPRQPLDARSRTAPRPCRSVVMSGSSESDSQGGQGSVWEE
jgi:hypothetical protein